MLQQQFTASKAMNIQRTSYKQPQSIHLQYKLYYYVLIRSNLLIMNYYILDSVIWEVKITTTNKNKTKEAKNYPTNNIPR